MKTMSRQWTVVDDYGRTWDTRGWAPNVAGLAVGVVLLWGLTAAGWPWFVVVLLAGLLGQMTRNSLQWRRHRRMVRSIERTAQDRKLDAQAREIKASQAGHVGQPGEARRDPVDVERAEQVAQLRVAVGAGLHWVDYSTGCIWTPVEAAELLRQEDRRAGHVAEIARLRAEIDRLQSSPRFDSSAYRLVTKARQVIIGLQRDIDMIDGKEVPPEPDPVPVPGYLEQAVTAGKISELRLPDWVAMHNADPDGTRRTVGEMSPMLPVPAFTPPEMGGEVRNDPLGILQGGPAVARLVRFSDGVACRLTPGDMQALIQLRDEYPTWEAFNTLPVRLPSGVTVPGQRVPQYAAELAELIRIEGRR